MEIIKKNSIKYIVIKEEILNKIIKGFYKSGDRIPSENELAEMYKVSKITTKRSLDELEKDGHIYRIKGSGSFVSDQVQRNGFNHLNMIAMVLPLGSSTGGGMDLFYSVEKIAKEHGYYVSIENTHSSCEKEREIILSLLRDNIKGIIYYPAYTSENFDLIKKLSIEGYPLVIIDKSIYDINIDTVVCDNYTGSYNLTKHLLNTGHKKIAFISEETIDETSSIRERFLGYCDALVEENISLDIDLIMYKTAYRHKKTKDNIFIKEVIKKIKENRSISALQVSTDVLAVELIKYCNMEGINVPEDISIVGFDNLDIASYISPALTTVRQNFKNIGENAAQLILKRLEDNGRKAEKVLIETELIVRCRRTIGNGKNTRVYLFLDGKQIDKCFVNR